MIKRVVFLSISILGVLLIISLWLNRTQDFYETKSQTPPEVNHIGFVGPLSGDAVFVGQDIKRGIELAQHTLGSRSKIIYEDSKCDPKQAVSAANKLIHINRVKAIIGDVCSSATLSIAPIAEQNRVVIISPASTSPEISSAGDYIFRTISSDNQQGVFAANLIWEQGIKKIGVLRSEEDYGQGLSSVLTQEFSKLGGEITAVETVPSADKDFKTQISKALAKKPEAIYIASNGLEATGIILKQLQELGNPARIFASETLNNPELISSLSQNATEGLTITAVSTGNERFKQSFKDFFGTEPGPFAALGYDAYLALDIALKKGVSTGEEIKSTLYGVQFEGATGKIQFDFNGDTAGSYDVLVVQNGRILKQ